MNVRPGIVVQRVTEHTAIAIDPRLRSNAAAVAFDDFVVAVDVGMKPYASRMFREALEAEFGRPVRYVCVTHAHADHTFGLSAFKDVTLLGSRALGAALEKSPDFDTQALEGMKRMDPADADWVNEVERVVPQVRFDGRLDVGAGGRAVEFHHSGGHTACGVWGYVPAERVLFSGDLIFAGMFPFAGDDTADPEAWMEILRSWTALAVDYVIPGHGPVCGPEEIARQLSFFEALKRNTLAALEAGAEASGIELPDIYPVTDMPWFAEKTQQHWHAYYRARSLAT
jgi:cyclase